MNNISKLCSRVLVYPNDGLAGVPTGTPADMVLSNGKVSSAFNSF